MTTYKTFFSYILLVLISSTAFIRTRDRFSDPYGPDTVQFRAEALQQARRSKQMREAVVFFGDSTVVGFATSTVVERSENFGIDGDTVDGLLARLPQYDLRQARTVVIEIGVNNWKRDKMARFGEKYASLLRMIPQSSTVLAMSIPPVAFRRTPYMNFTGAQPAFREANERIRQICSLRPNCRFVDLWPALADDSGNLKAEFDAGDGLHPSTAAYDRWKDALTPFIQSTR